MKKDLTEVLEVYNKFINFQVKNRQLVTEYEIICEVSRKLREDENDEELVCFEKNIKMPAIIFYDDDISKTQINKLVILYEFNEYDFFDIGFSLDLSIVTKAGRINFTLAATEEEDGLIPKLKINRRDLTISQRDSCTIKFSSRQNFQEILDICHDEVKKFNEQAPVKLINRLVKNLKSTS